MNTLYPIFLKLDQLELLIVGGGAVGHEKLSAVLKNSPEAKVNLVAPEIRKEVEELATDYPTVKLHYREFQWEDLNGKHLVILATDKRELHEEIKKVTAEKHLLTNVADTPDLCDFYLSSVVQKGDLKIGISTNGKSPTLAKRIREYLEEALPDEVQELMDNLQVFRSKLKDDFAHKVKALNDLTKKVF
ncbi:bifunctional precorrin-2 dehydrogenase/sirohydrochlorin ferrochelatase [Limibacter armeniacum]|uniref:precorrin-2 dehydrogenase/sirohydrochlorin ferrochelatase family protein n=1 Tax=Limibacter armeniacum TaxID=466084 RepID=UPI002FE643A9